MYLLFALLLSVSAPAADKTYLLDQPRLDGHLFDSESDEHGVCKAMGYERAALGSVLKSGSGFHMTHVVNRHGLIYRFGWIDRWNGYWVKQILCVNKARISAGMRNVLVHKPRHPESFAFFSTKSDATGICRLLGFRGTGGAVAPNGKGVGPVVILNGEGEVIGGEVTTDSIGTWISKVICLR
jgi:hypothetical protein